MLRDHKKAKKRQWMCKFSYRIVGGAHDAKILVNFSGCRVSDSFLLYLGQSLFIYFFTFARPYTFQIQDLIKFFNSVYFYSVFYNKNVSRCFTESETKSQIPQVSNVARKNSLLTGKGKGQE